MAGLNFVQPESIYTVTSQIQTPKMWAPSTTRAAFNKSLELGVVIGVTVACCSVLKFTDPTYGLSGPRSDKRGKGVLEVDQVL